MDWNGPGSCKGRKDEQESPAPSGSQILPTASPGQTLSTEPPPRDPLRDGSDDGPVPPHEEALPCVPSPPVLFFPPGLGPTPVTCDTGLYVPACSGCSSPAVEEVSRVPQVGASPWAGALLGSR
jgi:hypothetical protein